MPDNLDAFSGACPIHALSPVLFPLRLLSVLLGALSWRCCSAQNCMQWQWGRLCVQTAFLCRCCFTCSLAEPEGRQ